MSGKKQKRIDVIRGLMNNPQKQSQEEYLQTLHECRTMAACTIWFKAHNGIDDGVQAWANCLDKLHWLIDSCEKKDVSAGNGITIAFELPAVHAENNAEA